MATDLSRHRYSNHAIQAILTLKILFTQVLHQASLNATIPVRRTQEPLHLLIDNTGLKFYDEGEWKAKQQGMEYRHVHERSAELVTPPCKNAQHWKEKTD